MSGPAPASDLVRPAEEFPEGNFPTVYVDGAWSMVNSEQIVKIYFQRIDPNFAGSGRNKANPVLQLVMPVDAFVALFAFFEAQLGSMLQPNGPVSNESLERVRALFPDTRKP
jgi:hypothetical protein